MNLLLIFIFFVPYIICVKYNILCVKNCDGSAQLDAHKEIEIFAECIEGCTKPNSFLWELESRPNNILQSFEKDDILGFNTTFLTIKANVLRCGENYDLTFTIKYGGNTLTYVNPMWVAKCSKKYPPNEDTDETQFENDYTDFEDVQTPAEAFELSQGDLIWKIEEELAALQIMENKSDSFVAARQRVKILNLLELVDTDTRGPINKALNDTIYVGNYPYYMASVARKTLQVGLVLLNRAIDFISAPTEPYNSKYLDIVNNILRVSDREVYKKMTELIDHRPTTEKYESSDEDPQQDTVNYPDYNDFDLVYRKRKAIVEDIRFLRLAIMKLLARESTINPFGKTIDQLESCITTCYTISEIHDPISKKKIYRYYAKEFLKCGEGKVYISTGIHDYLEDLYWHAGLVFMTLESDLLWNHRPDGEYLAVYLGIGSRENPYLMKNLSSLVSFEVKYKTEQFTPDEGRLNLKDFFREEEMTRGYFKVKPVSNDTLRFHEILVGIPMWYIFIGLELRDEDYFKCVVLVDRRPYVEDFGANGSSFIISEKDTAIIPLEASPGSRIYLALMPFDIKFEYKYNNQPYKYDLMLTRTQCDYIDEYTRNVEPNACPIYNFPDRKVFECNCSKTGLYQMSQIHLRSRFIEPYVEPPHPLNFVPTITLGVVLFIYFVALVSKKIHRQGHVIVKRVQYLMDNNLTHEYGYFVVVTTKSSTTANIAFQLHGSAASTLPHLFRGQSEPVLQSNLDDWFYLLADNDLGDLQSIDLWSDCYGFESSWYCSRIKVIHQKTNQEWMFQVNDWFTPIGKKTFKTVCIDTSEETYYFPRHVYAIKALANHIWVKTFTKLQSPLFTFNERVHILLMIFTVNMMNTMLLLKLSHDNPGFWHFGYASYDFGKIEVLTGCCSGFVTFFLATLFIYFFSNSARCGASNTEQVENIKCKTCCRVTAWIFMIFFLLGSCGIVVGFGFFTGFVTSIVWLYTFLVGVLICIVMEFFRVMCEGFITRHIDPKVLTVDYKSIEIQQDKISRGLGNNGMRSLLQKYYAKLSDIEIREKEKNARKIKFFRFEKSEFITYVIYMLILFVIIICDRDPHSYISANNIRDIFIDDKHFRKIELSEINSQKRFYRYMRKVFLPAIHTDTWYHKYKSAAPGRLIDFNSRMIGVARIRQTRIRNGTCKVPKSFKHFVSECHSEYSLFIEDKQNYGESWSPLNESSEEKWESDHTWFYKNWLKMKAVPFIGELAIYPAGGYSMNFGRTALNSRIILRYIKNTGWIDERTRAIFLDVNLYNVNDNLFNFLTIAIEQSATGAFITNYQLNTLRFLYHGDVISRIVPFFWLSLSVFLVMFSWSKYYQYKEFHSSSSRQFWTDFWNFVDVLSIFLIFCLLITLGIRFLVVDNTLTSMKLSKQDFISYYDIIICHEIIEVTTAILLTFSTVRLWKFLRFLQQFQLFELTLKFSTKYLLSMMVVNVLLIMVYAVVGFLLLGPYVREFRTVWSSFVALMLISFGLEFNLGLDTTHQTMYSYVGYIYFTGYLILVLVLLNIFITIIVVGYKNSKEYLDHQASQDNYNILSFLKDERVYNRSKYKGRIRNIEIVTETNKMIREFRLRAGQDNLIPNTENSFNKISVNSQTMLEIHQLADKVVTLIQEKYRYSAEERHEQALKVLGHYYYRFSEDDPPKTTMYEEYTAVVDEDKENVYCSLRRQKAIKSIVEYLLNKKDFKYPTSIEQTRQIIEEQLNNIMMMRKMSEEMIVTLEKLLWGGCTNKSTQVTFADLGVDFSVTSSYNETSDIIEMEFLDGNLEIILNV